MHAYLQSKNEIAKLFSFSLPVLSRARLLSVHYRDLLSTAGNPACCILLQSTIIQQTTSCKGHDGIHDTSGTDLTYHCDSMCTACMSDNNQKLPINSKSMIMPIFLSRHAAHYGAPMPRFLPLTCQVQRITPLSSDLQLLRKV